MSDAALVLVVEDSPTQAVFLTRLLKGHGYEVATARNGVQALANMRAQRPTIVVSDVQMPDMTGLEMCGQIKADAALASIPVILLTSLSDVEDIIRGLQAGADSYVTKPYDEQLLLSRIDSLLAPREPEKDADIAAEGLSIRVGGKQYVIESKRTQILNLLISTFEGAVQQNRELTKANEALARAHSELQGKNHQLNQLVDEKNAFLGMAAHDLRNPMGVALTYSQYLLGEKADPLTDKQRKFLNTIQRSTQFMLNLVEDLLQISAIEAGKLQLTLKAVDIADLTRHTVEMHTSLADKKNIAIEVKVPATGLTIEVDEQKFEQVLNNLISNAVKFSPPDTVVRVTVAQHGDEVQISVSDQGPGIKPEDRDKLFVAFEKTSNKPTAGEKSTGLGLCIVKRIVEGHQGRIWVDSEAGQGSRFEVVLPVSRTAAVPAPA